MRFNLVLKGGPLFYKKQIRFSGKKDTVSSIAEGKGVSLADTNNITTAFA